MVRRIFISLAGGGGALLLEYLVVRFVPLLGIVFWIPTLIGLSVLEDFGLPTLQGSPDGWPLATTFGAVIAGGAWWFVWSAVVAVVLWRKRHQQ